MAVRRRASSSNSSSRTSGRSHTIHTHTHNMDIINKCYLAGSEHDVPVGEYIFCRAFAIQYHQFVVNIERQHTKTQRDALGENVHTHRCAYEYAMAYLIILIYIFQFNTNSHTVRVSMCIFSYRTCRCVAFLLPTSASIAHVK